MATETKRNNDPLFTIRSFARTEKGNGVILNASARSNDGWQNVRIYVPFSVNVTEEHADDAQAVIRTGKLSGRPVCTVFIVQEWKRKPRQAAQPAEESSDDGDGIPFA